MPANCGVASVFRATQVSPLRLAAASCGVATVVRAVMDVGAPFMTPGAGTARPVRGVVRGSVRGVSGQLCRCDGRRAVMDVGAPFMTPGAGTARPVRGIARGGVRGVSGQLRRCVGFPGDTSVAPTFGGGILRHSVGCSGGDGRRGAIYDARCRNGTTRPRRCAMRCTRRFRPIAALRRFSGRHKCRPYVLAACVAATLSADALKLSAGLFFLSQ